MHGKKYEGYFPSEQYEQFDLDACASLFDPLDLILPRTPGKRGRFSCEAERPCPSPL